MKKSGKPKIGKHVLVAFNQYDTDNNITEQEQLHGTIVSISDTGILLERADGGGKESLPFELEMELGDPDLIYELASTKEKVTNVDLIASWDIYPPNDGDE
jgi:hypothetical protein